MSSQTTCNPYWSGTMILLLIITGAAALMISAVSADTGSPAGTGIDGTVTINPLADTRYSIWEDMVTFSGTNTGSETTYLFITGPNLKPDGAQIQSTHPFQSPVIDGDASTFQAAHVGPDNRWSYTWDTHNVMIDAGSYTVYAAGTPRDLAHINSTHFDKISFVMARPGSIVQPAGTDTSGGGGASAETGVTLAAPGDRSFYLGEEVVFTGHNNDSGSTYLFMTGPGTFVTGPGIPDDGGKLTSPLKAVVSGNPDSFTVVKTKPDKTWEYVFYTANLPVDAGSYTVYAVSEPKAKNHLGSDAASVSIILKKPFITAEITPSSVSKGQPFTVTGTAEGEPAAVQLWIFGNNYGYTTTTPVLPGAAFTFTGDSGLSGKLPAGQCYLIVQHSMQNNTFDITASGDYVRGNNNGILFRVKGPGSLQGRDAADALAAAFSDPGNGDDTYTMVPFMVEDAGISAPRAQPTPATPVQQPTPQSPLTYAIFGAFVLIVGIAPGKRR
jgi:hypothetical protein